MEKSIFRAVANIFQFRAEYRQLPVLVIHRRKLYVWSTYMYFLNYKFLMSFLLFLSLETSSSTDFEEDRRREVLPGRTCCGDLQSEAFADSVLTTFSHCFPISISE